MSTATASPTLDLSLSPKVPLARLVRVELRKSFDTRAGRWFTLSILALTLIVLTIGAFAFPEGQQDYRDNVGLAGGVLGYFLPILPIMLVTSEWGQRTGLVTFTLEPHRLRVVVAKLLAGVLLSIGVMLIAFVLAALATAVGGIDGSPDWSLNRSAVQNFFLANLIGVLIGFALGMLLMNTAAAIVAYFVYSLVLPTVASFATFVIDGFDKVLPWIEFNTAQIPMFTGDFKPTGQEWAQIAVSGTIWLIIPFALGLVRLLRAEVK